MKFIVIGITDNPRPFFAPKVLELIRQGAIFSGGKRHHEIMVPLLPDGAKWIDITVPLERVFERYREETGAQMSTGKECLPIIVFASGDPLFFGFANTLRREFPDAGIQVLPTFNSLQMLAHRLLMPYHDMRIVSLTGRPWQEFDRALIERSKKIGILTDREHTPAAIARRMLDYGYVYYQMHIGEHLGHPEQERVTTLPLGTAAAREFTMPNCVILDTQYAPTFLGKEASSYPFGLPDASFSLLNGREKMITKMPIRLMTLQALDLPHRHVLWDIGACTGSVSIEARLLFPHLHIDAFEIRPECEAIIHENARKFGAPGIHVHMGDFLNTPIPIGNSEEESVPNAVFIGGHGGKLQEIMAKVVSCLAPNGIIVMNSVKAPKVQTDSHRLWDEACATLGLRQEPPTRIVLDDHHPIKILKCRK